MGESFRADLSTGTATFSIPIAMPFARGAAQPVLALSYATASGNGVSGYGWSTGVPFIARETDEGIPRYIDPRPGEAWNPAQDRFVFNGAELVQICMVSATLGCSGALAEEVMPAWSAGWRYFRARTEENFDRFFWSPDLKTWRVQLKSGMSLELGVPLDGSGATNALETELGAGQGAIFRWNIARQYDTYGSGNPAADAQPRPYNVVVYRYTTAGGIAYLSDIYDTPPSASSNATLSTYAHHTRLEWEARPDPLTNYRRGWETSQGLRLARVDITSKPFASPSAQRQLVRRYHLKYDATSHVSLLESVTLEGRCSGNEATGVPSEDANGVLGTTSCAKLPPITFEYSRVRRADGSAPVSGPPGFEGFDDTVQALPASPRYPVDGVNAELFDINSDGLPDLLLPTPSRFGGDHALILNGANGTKGAFGNPVRMPVTPVSSVDASVLTLGNINVAPLDLDGDGALNLVHMPFGKRPAIFTAVPDGTRFRWAGRTTNTSPAFNPRFDLGMRSRDTRIADVNGDGLVDVLVDSGVQFETYLSLGRFRNGDGKFGRASRTGKDTVELSAEPSAACVPWRDDAVRLSDPRVKLADMNADGLIDVVRLSDLRIEYWPGRGNGVFGTGNRNDCRAGTFPENRHVAMANSPSGVQPVSGTVPLLNDLNGDGLPDLAVVRTGSTDVWLNIDGRAWSAVISLVTPMTIPDRQVRLVDINGSGTKDLVWAETRNYRYIDLLGGSRPWLLSRVRNGLGQVTEIKYGSSVDEMFAATAAGKRWTSLAPIATHLVKRITVHDGLDAVGRTPSVETTEYSYADPVFDGRSRAFRGFREAASKRLGDTHAPTMVTRVSFLMGECKEDGVAGRCAPENVWMDNPREALRGKLRTMEVADERGVTLSTRHVRYRVRSLYTGLDGTVVRHAFSVAESAFSYDTAAFVSQASSISLSDTEVEQTPGSVVADPATAVRLASNTWVRTETASIVDSFGNVIESANYGCTQGCAQTDEAIVSHRKSERLTTDGSGWMFRATESYTVGSNQPDETRRRETVEWDARGRMYRVWAELKGTLPLLRSHISGKKVAPLPAEASQDGLILQSTREYDAYGNLLSVRAAGKSCRTFTYDSTYADFRLTETTYAGTAGTNGCGTRALTTRAEYDRGFATTRRLIAFNSDPSQLDFDEFARPVRSWQPDPGRSGALSSLPTSTYEYFLPSNATSTPYSIVRSRAQDGASPDTDSYREMWSYFDGGGRLLARLTQADRAAGDAGDWVVAGLSDMSAGGVAFRDYDPWFWTGDPAKFPLATRPTSPATTKTFDAFGRPLTVVSPTGITKSAIVYHAASTDLWDATDLAQGGEHYGTYTTEQKDGHGRILATIERVAVNGAVEGRETRYAYLPTGEVTQITRTRVGKSDAPVTRWMRYDSLGRMVMNADPNATKNFVADPGGDVSTVYAYRYAYDEAGNLVATSDARGCGVNYHYDTAGRIVAEDFSPCVAVHQAYSAPNLTNGNGTEAFYGYDQADPALATMLPAGVAQGSFLGRLASISDRGSRSVLNYDRRGRLNAILKQLARPGPPNSALTRRYAPHYFRSRSIYDGADRVFATSTGTESTELLGEDGASDVFTVYSKRGRVRSVDSSYGVLIADITRNARGMSESVTYGDLPGTQSLFGYDAERRLVSIQTYRGAPALWNTTSASYTPPPAGQPSTLQRTLVNSSVIYDDADNPTSIFDDRNPDEWPVGAKPVDRVMTYDSLYRVKSVKYTYSSSDDVWVSPFDAENRGRADGAKPRPHAAFDRRLREESFEYDWLGNTTASNDDAGGFFDRSLGTITNGTATSGPYQLKSASNRALGGSRAGDLSVTYDATGNMRGLHVRRSGPCLPSTASCSHRYEYEWDEAGRLATAQRWDLSAAEADVTKTPARAANVVLRYAYDSSDERVTKTAEDASGAQLHTLYVFETLEHHRTTFDGTNYVVSAATEVPYLFSQGRRVGRVVTDTLPSATGERQHVLLELSDTLGSIQTVIDKETGELVEHATYQAYGATESDYRPERWKSFRESHKFTGKEEDVEVGLHYFGKRYYAAHLGRWISADPLAIHEAKADHNVYAYVHGRAFVSTDPNGTCEIVCITVISAAIGAGVNVYMQFQQYGEIRSGSQIVIAALAGAVGGYVGGAAGSLVAGGLASTLSSGAAVFAGSLAGGVAGSMSAGIVNRGGNGLVAMSDGGDLQDALDSTFNPQALETDIAFGLLSGGIQYGFGQILRSAQPRLTTPPPAQPKPQAPAKLTKAQTGAIGEDEIPDVLRGLGADDFGPIQNGSNHGLDGIGINTRTNEVWAVEAKASVGGRAPGLSKAQSDMNDFVAKRLEAALAPNSKYPADAQALAQRVQDALDKGANLRSLVVETRYAGSNSQFTRTRPWTNTTPRSGQTLPPQPTAAPALGPGTGSFSGMPKPDAAMPVLPLNCYSTGNGARCDTTVIQW